MIEETRFYFNFGTHDLNRVIVLQNNERPLVSDWFNYEIMNCSWLLEEVWLKSLPLSWYHIFYVGNKIWGQESQDDNFYVGNKIWGQESQDGSLKFEENLIRYLIRNLMRNAMPKNNQNIGFVSDRFSFLYSTEANPMAAE